VISVLILISTRAADLGAIAVLGIIMLVFTFAGCRPYHRIPVLAPCGCEQLKAEE